MRLKTYNTAELLNQICEVVPLSATRKILWVRARPWVADVEVAFRLPYGHRCIYIPTREWLNDKWIARLCLEAMTI